MPEAGTAARRDAPPAPGADAAAPDFFILGAAKCGTTALATYLAEHPGVYFAVNKEPNYFSRDLAFCRFDGTLADYTRVFFPDPPAGRLLGEGTPFYLYSRVAVREILAVNPAARFIVLLRNPVEQVQAMHAQRVFNCDEDRTDFAEAWRLQGERARGRHLPPGCRDPQVLQYREIARYPAQLERLFAAAPRERCKVILFDDLAADPGAVYRDVLAFLGLPDDGRTDFPRVNERAAHRSRLLARALREPPPVLVQAAAAVRRVTGRGRLGLGERLEQVNARKGERPALDPVLKAELVAEFAPEIAALGRLLGRDLGHWTAP